MRRAASLVGLGLALAAALVPLGCRGNSEDFQSRLPTPEVSFRPRQAVASAQFAAGRYANLFDPATNAVWGGADGATAGPLVIDLYTASAFADTSVAYDVAGLRGIDVYLLMPRGEKVRPGQMVRGAELEEQPRGALKFYARRNRLVFPVRANEITTIIPSEGARPVRLVLEGHGTTFHFVWETRLPDPATYEPAPGDRARATVGAAGDAGARAWGRVRAVTRKMD